MKRWETMAAHPQHWELKEALDEGIKSLRKWYNRVDNTSPAYFICVGMFSHSLFLECRLTTLR
jgi:hypothetical protein